jgi:hypothetical protein
MTKMYLLEWVLCHAALLVSQFSESIRLCPSDILNSQPWYDLVVSSNTRMPQDESHGELLVLGFVESIRRNLRY